MKKLNITKKHFNESKYFQDKYGKLEYISESGKIYKTDKGNVIKFVKESLNKYDVPYHVYELTLADGSKKTIDIGVEEDWGNVQQCTPEDCKDWKDSVGWGNDEDGHVKIVKVQDYETGDIWKGSKVKEWAEKCVWSFVDNYATESSNDIDHDPAYTCPYCGGHNCEFEDAHPGETNGFFDGSTFYGTWICLDCEKDYDVEFTMHVTKVG